MKKQYLLFLICNIIFIIVTSCSGSGNGGSGNSGSGNSGSGNSGSDTTMPSFNFSASRTAGVAPLGVFFNSGFSEYTSSDNPFHDLEYLWDFGDTEGDYWAIEEDSISERSKNTDKGPVAAHVYENPGTYTVTLSVRDETGVIANEQLTITVEDPDSFYSGDNTICISDSTSNDFTGCPNDAVQVETNNIADIQDHLGANKRILLRRGSTWVFSDAGILRDVQNLSSVTIGAYGAKGTSDSRGICDNAPEITITGSGYFLAYNSTSDWRVQDISFIGSTSATIISGATDAESLLALRLKSTGFGVPVGFSDYLTNGHDQLMIVDCDFSNSYGNTFFIGSERLVLMGNYLRNAGHHVIRIWQAYLGVISHNNVSGSSNTAPGLHALKFHGKAENGISTTDDDLVDHRSEYVVISDNIFGSSGPWPVAVGPQNTDYDERLSNLIIEKNRFIAGYGQQNDSAVQVLLLIWARSVTVRNNIFDGTGSTEFGRAVYVGTRGPEPAPQNIQIYNNTVYKNDITGDTHSYSGFDFDNTVNQATVSVKNNLIQFPVEGNNNVITCDPDCSLLDDSNNLLTDNPEFTDVTNGYLQQDFSLLPDSPANSGGTDVPVFDDFIGTDRPGGGSSIGAFE